MDKRILDILIDNCTNERLDNIIMKNKQFQEIETKANTALDTLSEMLTQGQNKALNEYCTQQNALSAMYARLAYEQGMRDIASLWQELTKK